MTRRFRLIVLAILVLILFAIALTDSVSGQGGDADVWECFGTCHLLIDEGSEVYIVTNGTRGVEVYGDESMRVFADMPPTPTPGGPTLTPRPTKTPTHAPTATASPTKTPTVTPPIPTATPQPPIFCDGCTWFPLIISCPVGVPCPEVQYRSDK